MQRFRVFTLVDITRTNVFKESMGLLQKKQQDNFQTLHQTLEIRAIIFTEQNPKCITMDWSEYGYGKEEKTWEWSFFTERDDLYDVDGDPIGGMIKDVQFVPFIPECEETAKFKNHFFSTELKPINILFQLVDK